ncbi:MAG: hypothetical protein WCS70_02130 [Verrucomicrobiota bacterium]
MKFKPDFATTAARFEAWWRGEVMDRPPVTLAVQPTQPYRGPVSQHATLRERWLDAEFQVATAIARMEQTDYLGDSLPIFFSNIGPEITATLLGCELEFGEHTSWSKPVVHEAGQWEEIIARPPDFQNVYWQTMERATALARDRCDDRYLVGITDLHDSFDMLAGLRDPQQLCVDLLDCPELVRRVAVHAAHVFAQAFDRCYKPGAGSTCWTPFYHAGPAYVPSCDFWCMIAPELARDLVVPTKHIEMAALERSIFHLDGPQALKHLDTTLTLPGLTALQWVYGAGQGPAARWLDVYRRALAAGKSVQVIAETPADAFAVLDALGPRGVWFTVGDSFATVTEATAFLTAIEQRSRG